LTAVLREAWSTSQQAEDRREKIQALSLAKECYSMKLDLLTNATVVDDAIRFVSEKSKDKDHIIGLPTKDGLEKPIFDYQELLYEALLSPDICNPLNHGFKDKHLWIKKATGLGVTEFFLRFMAWLCLRNNDYRNSQMCIVTGPNIDIAIKLIKRMKSLFERKMGLTFPSKETVIELKGCRIEAYPSNHIDAYRALDNPHYLTEYKKWMSWCLSSA
jgi:hypothetical protein